MTPDSEVRGAPSVAAPELIRLQQGLLAEGYTYIDGDAASWPATPVLMHRGGSYVLVAPWPVHPALLRDFWEELRRNAKAAGLLLVGEDEPGDPDLAHLFEAVGGAIVYLQAPTGAMRERRTVTGMPEVFAADRLARLREPGDAAHAIDCRTVLAQHLAKRAEQAQAEAWLSRPPGRPLVTYALIALCTLVFLGAMHAIGGRGGGPRAGLQVAVQWGALVPALVHAGQPWRLLTAGFLHIEVLHLLFNMIALYNLGVMLEHWQGRVRYAVLFLASVVTSSLLVVWWQSGDTVTLGASGGVFGLLGGFIAIAVRYWRDFSDEVRQRVFGWIPRVLLLNAIISFLPNISLFGHLGGLLGGFLVGLVILRSPARFAPEQR